MKSLHKSLDILEYVINRDSEPVTPSEVADNLDLNLATCARIMGEYAKKGYLRQISRREGYIPGPAVYTFADRLKSPYSRLARAAAEPIRQLAIKYQTVINISVMQNGERYILYHHSFDSNSDINLNTRYTKYFYDTATGRLLMAFASPGELKAILKNQGLPGEKWDGIDDYNTLEKELKKILKDGEVCFRHYNSKQWIVGAIINIPEFPPAALGFGISGDNCEEVMKDIRATVSTIVEQLTPQKFSI